MAAQHKRLYIVGAGFAGRKIAREIQEKSVLGEVVAFLDDDAEKIGKVFEGVPVLGPIKDVARLLRTKAADEAIIAIPGANPEYLRSLYHTLKEAGFEKIRILPSIAQIIEDGAHLVQTRSIDLQDLLGRTPVQIQLKKSLAYLRGRRVLVTGAGGSIGQELCRQLLSGSVERLYLLGHGENSIYQIDKELRILQEAGVGVKTAVVPVLGSLADADFLDYIMGKLRTDVVFHTAAYKHVPLCEENPASCIKNNVFGTHNLIEASKKHGVARFVLISTDKAVDPVSVYGASKNLCERLVLEAGKKSSEGETQFMAVRFGNVLGSRGSIVPLFQSQIERGGPVTITHPDMERWFMTIPEASSLVLKAGGVGQNGALYLLDMGESVRIKDVAAQMIKFYGLEPDVDIKIETVGLRPGERLGERLYSEDETPIATGEEKLLIVKKKRKDAALDIDIEEVITKLRPACFFDKTQGDLYRDSAYIKGVLGEAVPSFG